MPLDLTGSAPDLVSDSTAGLSHTWSLTNRYYNANIPIWVDEISDVSEWQTAFSEPEAKEVVTVLGAWIFCFRKPLSENDIDAVKEKLKAIADVIERACGFGGDAVCLAVAMPQTTTPFLDKSHDEWDDICMEYGFEFVDSEAKGKNEFGEETGIMRVQGALEAHDWEGGDGYAEYDFDDDESGGGLDAEEAEMGVELFGLKAAVNGAEEDDEEGQVEELESMMRKMIAIKGMHCSRETLPSDLSILTLSLETGEGMPEAERKRFAARAVNDLMKDL